MRSCSCSILWDPKIGSSAVRPLRSASSPRARPSCSRSRPRAARLASATAAPSSPSRCIALASTAGCAGYM
eukprot:812580-Alexandrium_andersonii.AAC.1